MRLDPVEPLRGAIIGCGFFSQFHLESWRRMEGVDLVAACDLDATRAASAAPRAYTDPEQMLDQERPNFVDIATRPDTHLPLVRLCVARRIPVICQKPVAPSWDDAVTMAAVAAESGVPVMIHENWRWQRWFRELDRLLSDGVIGAPISYAIRMRKRDGFGPDAYPAQPYFREMPRLLIFETLVHHIDTARFLFGPIESLYARTRRVNPLIAGEDCVLLVAGHQSGIMGSIDGHRFSDCMPNGDAMGEALVEGETGSLQVLANGDILHDGARIWSFTGHSGYKGDSVHATQRHFIECLRSGSAFETSAAEYLKTFAAVEAAYESAASGRAVAPLQS